MDKKSEKIINNKNQYKDSVSETINNELKELFTLDGIQKYILGTKKDGKPRALYDVIKGSKKGKKKKKKDKSGFNLYKVTKKKKKKGKKKDHWHIDNDLF